MNGWVGCTMRWRTLALAVMASGCGPMIELEGDTEPTSDDGLTSTTPGQGCTPWYEAGMAPAGYEDVGACSVPM